MRMRFLMALVMIAAFQTAAVRAQTKNAAGDQHALIGVTQSKASAAIFNDPARKWFPEAGLGLFVHWGISSVTGRHDLSWGMMGKWPYEAHPLTPEAYWALADQFNPQDYHPEKWLQAAKDAGFGYAVLTTRHHDGYALWPSECGDFSTRTKLGGRDLLQPYVDACRKVGLRVGFYYSPPDWHFNREYMSFASRSKGTPDSPHFGTRHQPVELPKPPADFQDKYIAYVNGQIKELMTRYGKIDLLWFDGGAGKGLLSQEEIRKLQPDIVINNRAHGQGDFHAGPECKLPTSRPSGCWEYCGGLTSCWGYRAVDERNKPRPLAARLLSQLALCRAWGGNVLENCGPRSTGDMPECYYGCMEEVKSWMAKCGESVMGVEAGSYPDKCNVPVTRKGDVWYAHLLPLSKETEPACLKPGEPIVLKDVELPKAATWLATGKSLQIEKKDNTIVIAVPADIRTPLVDVVKITW